MTLDKFLSTPDACIICNTVEDFEFLQKIFVKKNIRWSNGHEFNNYSPNLESPETYPVYITSKCMWGIVADTEMFSKMTIILDMETIDDFYDEIIFD